MSSIRGYFAATILLFLAARALADPIVTEWTNTYGFPPYTYGAMVAVDPGGNVLSVGSAPGGSDLITLKYNAAGEMIWERHYTMAGFSLRATWVAADAAGNVVVTGYPQTFSSNPVDIGLLTLKYDVNGNLLWDDLYEASRGTTTRAVVGSDGAIFVTGKIFTGTNDFLTIKYLPDGTRSWVDTFDYQGGFHAPISMDLDANQNLLVAGGGIAGSGTLVVRYAPDGTRQWIAWQPGSAGSGVKWANDGSFFTAGNMWSMATNEDLRLLRWNGDGSVAWEQLYDFGHSELGTKLALDPSGNVFVSGYETSGGYSNWITIKTNSSGDLLWSVIQDSHPSNDESPGFLVPGPDGELYVTGIGGPSPIPGNTYLQMVTLRYNSDGSTAWTAKHWEWASRGVGAALDPAGNVYVVGLGNSITTIKYAPTAATDVTRVPTATGSGLEASRPNPFRASTEIAFSLREESPVRLLIHDVAGRCVRTLVEDRLPAGRHERLWDGRDESGREVASGIYYSRLELRDQVTERTVVRLR